MKENLIALGAAVVFLTVGVVCLLWPHEVQRLILQFYAQHGSVRRFNPFLSWMETSSYIIALRLIGTIALIGFVFLLVVFLRAMKVG